MSRSGYVDDLDQSDLAMWRGRVASAIRGRRGQKLLRDMLSELEAMSDQRLIAHELVDEHGECCALGAACRYRGIPEFALLDSTDHHSLGEVLDVAPCLIQEIEWLNDESGLSGDGKKRFERVRKWLLDHIQDATNLEVRGDQS